jgi:hypothetical protein
MMGSFDPDVSLILIPAKPDVGKENGSGSGGYERYGRILTLATKEISSDSLLKCRF